MPVGSLKCVRMTNAYCAIVMQVARQLWSFLLVREALSAARLGRGARVHTAEQSITVAVNARTGIGLSTKALAKTYPAKKC